MRRKKRKYVRRAKPDLEIEVAAVPQENEGPPPDPDVDAFERASAAAAGALPEGELPPTPEPVEPTEITPDALVALLELLYSLATDLGAKAYGVDDAELLAKLATIVPQERKLLEITAPFALKNAEKLQQWLDRFGGLAFGAVVFLGMLSRHQILKRWARAHAKEKKPEDNFGFKTPEEAEAAARKHCGMYSTKPD